MTGDVLRTVGQIAGLAGIALGVFLLIAREFLRKDIFPRLSRPQSYRLLRMLLILTWAIAAMGIGAWIYAGTRATEVARMQDPARKARLELYQRFLANVSADKSALLAEFLHVGSLAELATTDSEVQGLEDALYDLLHVHGGRLNLTLQLRTALDPLVASASPKVQACSEDILHALNAETALVDLRRYPSDVQEFCSEWQRIQREGSTYGWDARVSDDERLGIIMSAKLYRHLLQLLNAEIGQT
jgi:hypothetical protein